MTPHQQPNHPMSHPGYADDEIDLVELFQAIYQRKTLIIGLAFGLAFLVALFSLTLENKYSSEAVLVPVESGGASGMLSQYAGLASLAGISLPKNEGSSTQEALAIIQSRQFMGQFILQNKLKPILFAESWDVENQRWIEQSPGLVQSIKALILPKTEQAEMHYPGQEVLQPGEPSLFKATEVFAKLLSVNDDAKSGVVKVSVEFTDPVLARDWVNQLVIDINQHLREQELQRAQRSIEFLQKQLQEITLVEHRQVAYKIIEENLKKLTIAQTESDYVFRVIDPAVVPENKSAPKRSLMVAVGLVLGFMLGVFIALILNWRQKQTQQNQQE